MEIVLKSIVIHTVILPQSESKRIAAWWRMHTCVRDVGHHHRFRYRLLSLHTQALPKTKDDIWFKHNTYSVQKMHFKVSPAQYVSASLISSWLLWWPPAESHYNIHDHSTVGYATHAHCIVYLLASIVLFTHQSMVINTGVEKFVMLTALSSPGLSVHVFVWRICHWGMVTHMSVNWVHWSLVRVMACTCGARQLPKPIHTYYQLDPSAQWNNPTDMGKCITWVYKSWWYN